MSFPGGTDNRDTTPKLQVSQAKIELLSDDIGANIGAMRDALNAADAMREAGDTVGLIYGLRRSRAYWRAITGSAAELVTADAERLSALRQEAGAI